MAFKHGKATTVWLGSIDLSPFLNSMDLAVDGDTADTTTFLATWKSAIAGAMGAKVDFGGLYDPGETTLEALILSMVPGALTYCPAGGAAIGDRARLVSAIETAYAESSPVGGVVAVKGSFLADGVVGFGDVLHPLAEDTNTTTGATSQRLRGAAGATLRRHVRYVATRTGGSAGDGITFALAYSRN